MNDLINRILNSILGEMKQKLQDENLNFEDYSKLNYEYQEMFDNATLQLEIHMSIMERQQE